MRKAYHFFFILLCLVVSIDVNAFKVDSAAKGDFKPIELHQSNQDPSLIQRVPASNPLLLSCYVIEDFNSILLSSNRPISVEVEIRNLSTAESSSYAVVLSSAVLSLPIHGDGDYLLSISLSNGVSYYGEFEIN